MTAEAQINFYLSEREPKEFSLVNKNGDKIQKTISGYHFQYIAWQRIVQLYHPRKFPVGGQLRQLAANLCKYAIEYALSKAIEKTEVMQLRKAYKSITDAQAEPGKTSSILN